MMPLSDDGSRHGLQGNKVMKRWRHFTVAVGIMPALAIYVGAMVWLSTFIIEVHFLLDLLFFTVAGLAWIPAASAVVKWLAQHEAE